jgi:Ca-activated chloride channel homolog
MMIHWGCLHHGWYFVLAVILVLLTWKKYCLRNKLAVLLNKSGKLLRNFSALRNLLKAFLASVGIVALFLALLHPKWGVMDEVVEQEGRDLFVALDVSRSMLTQDVSPDRLSCAKKALSQLVDQLETDRIALMVFSERARAYCPLTHDKDLVKMFLGQIDYAMIGEGTTLLEQPVRLTIDQCDRIPDKKSKVLVLVTDGEDFSSSLEKLKKQAQNVGLTILVIGVGTSVGAPIPSYNEYGKRTGYIKDKKDQVVISQLHEQALVALAQATGGTAIFIRDGNADVGSIVRRIKQFEKERQGKRSMTSLQEQYPWFLLLSFICFLLEWIL